LGDWAPNLLGSFFFRAPGRFTFQWRRDGVAVAGATQATFTPSEAGQYTCRVTASNPAGSSVQTSAPRSVTGPEPPPPDPTPAIRVIGLERDRAAGTATLTVEANVAGGMWLAKTNKVKRTATVDLSAAGSAELEVIPRNRAAGKLRRTGRLKVNPQVRFGPRIGGVLNLRHQFQLRRD
jgi:hypothetical protein